MLNDGCMTVVRVKKLLYLLVTCTVLTWCRICRPWQSCSSSRFPGTSPARTAHSPDTVLPGSRASPLSIQQNKLERVCGYIAEDLKQFKIFYKLFCHPLLGKSKKYIRSVQFLPLTYQLKVIIFMKSQITICCKTWRKNGM